MKTLKVALKPGHFIRLLSLILLSAFATHAAWAAPRVKVLKLAVSNPTDGTRERENVVVGVAELKRVAPDFKAGGGVGTTSDAATPAEDARPLHTTELPYQAREPCRHRTYGERAFQT